MNEPLVTLQGWLGGEVRLREAGGAPVADFRLAVTPSRFDRRSGSWVDETTQWYTVTLWRRLAEHADRSLHSGDPVVVHGRLGQRRYTNAAGAQVTVFEVTAIAVGHDLGLGTSVFSRAEQPAREAALPTGAGHEEAAEASPASVEPAGVAA